MKSKNDITGDSLISKATTEAYSDGWDRIFGKNKQERLGKEFEKVLYENLGELYETDTPSADDHGLTEPKTYG